jgi:hypothetical protein
MAWILTDDQGNVYRRDIGSLKRTKLTLPAGVYQRVPYCRPDFVTLNGATLIVGQFNVPLVHTVDRKLWKAGIEPGSTAPTIDPGSGTGITGSVQAKLTFAEIALDGRVIAESNPTDASFTISLVDQGVAYSELPTSHPNARVNYKRLYESRDGDAFLFVANVALADDTYSHNTPTNELSATSEVSTRRAVPPYMNKITKTNGRVWGNDGTKSIRYTEIDELESWAAVNEQFTKDREGVTCLKGLFNELFIGTRVSIQQLTGFGLSDFNVEFIRRGLGVISHHGAVSISNSLWFPSQEGYYRYAGGSVDFLMENLRTYFREAYEADETTYQDIVAVVDHRRHYVIVLVPGSEEQARVARYYAAAFLPTETALGGEGRAPYWSRDTSTRYERTIAALTDGDLLDRWYSADCGGYARLMDVNGTTDDGTAYDMEIGLKHYFMGSQGGDDGHARTFEDLEMFVKSESSAWTLEAFVGDDGASSALTADYGPKVVPASAGTMGGRAQVPKTRHSFPEIHRSGHGITPWITCTSPNGFELRGLEIYFSNDGDGNRGRTAA